MNVCKQAGFTLIELILTLILCGLTATMILPLFQSGVTSSSTPIFRLERVGELEACMANIIAAVRAPSSSSDAQNPYQVRDGGMQALKEAIESQETFSQWVPDGASITAVTEGPYKLGTKSTPVIEDSYDQNYVLKVTLIGSDNANLTYYFCEGTNYQAMPDDGWGGSGES